MDLNKEQLEAVHGAINCEHFYSITGAAGTGKSTVIQAISNLLNGKTVDILAPTGRAAQLLANKIGKGMTIHKYLAYTSNDNGVTFHPQYGTTMKRNADYVIVDEASMIPRDVFDNLLRALPDQCKLIMVGDPNQLPPIEKTEQKSAFKLALDHFPYTSLVERYRFGKQLALSNLSDAVLAGDFKGMLSSNMLYRLDGVTDETLLNRLASNSLYWGTDAQIISPVYKGLTGCDYINRLVQAHRALPVKLTVNLFRGDKVITTVNTPWFSNGDIFYLENITEQEIVLVKDEHKLTVERIYSPCKGVMIDLVNVVKPAYCITTHKSQGGEYKHVVYIVGKPACYVLDRHNIYTGVTRSSENLCVLYDLYTMKRGLANVSA